MPRRARKLQFGEYYHIINRGSVRERIFYAAVDYQIFITLLAQAVDRFDLPLLSYCVMPNHWHMVVKPKDIAQLSKSMHWLTATHGVRWCRMHERKGPGPIYQGRFKAIPVEAGLHLLRACRYVERNGLRAQLASRAEQWPWGSANQRLTSRDQPRLLPLQFLTPAAWLRILNEPVDDTGASEAVRKNRPFASEDWINARLAAMGATRLRDRGRPRKMNN